MEIKSLNQPVFISGLVMAITPLEYVFWGGPGAFGSLCQNGLQSRAMPFLSVVWDFASNQLSVMAGLVSFVLVLGGQKC